MTALGPYPTLQEKVKLYSPFGAAYTQGIEQLYGGLQLWFCSPVST